MIERGSYEDGTRVCWLLITDGRLGVLEKTLDSWKEKLCARISHIMIVDDSGEKSYNERMSKLHSHEVDAIYHHTKRLGYSATIQDSWSKIPADCHYILHLEDDFLLNRELDLSQMIDVLKHDKKVAQIGMLRQPWSAAEINVGGFLKLYPADYHNAVYCIGARHYYPVIINSHNWSFNPCIYPREITELGFPSGSYEAECKFTEKLKDRICLIWGPLNQEPLVHHFGQQHGKAF